MEPGSGGEVGGGGGGGIGRGRGGGGRSERMRGRRGGGEKRGRLCCNLLLLWTKRVTLLCYMLYDDERHIFMKYISTKAHNAN